MDSNFKALLCGIPEKYFSAYGAINPCIENTIGICFIYSVIKPKDSMDTNQRAPPPPTLAEIASMEAANEERRRATEFDRMTNAIQTFLKKMQPYVEEMDLEKDPINLLEEVTPDIIEALINEDQRLKLLGEQQ